MLCHGPAVAPDTFVVSSAVLAGDVRVGPGSVIDYSALIVSSDTPVDPGVGGGSTSSPPAARRLARPCAARSK
jgi:hypothetical protein